MARFVTALALLTIAPAATAFCPGGQSFVSRRNTLPRLDAAEGTDFDAPTPYYAQSGTTVLDHEPIVDDECYMGAEGNFLDCVDFDPPRTTRSANAHDQPRSPPKWAFGDDFDAPIPAYPQSGTTVLDHEPVVDDECYMGAEGNFGGCVDFDPPRTTRSANAHDQPRSPPKWAFGDDFDAPVLANPQSGTTVLDHEPVVDDECYMGRDGNFGGCVDFDPPKQANDWTNVMDTPLGKAPRDLPKWARKNE